MRVAKVRFALLQRTVGETGTSPRARGQLHRHSVPVPDKQGKLLEDLCRGRIQHRRGCATGADQGQRADDEVTCVGESAGKACLRSRRTTLDRTTRGLLSALLDRTSPGRGREERNERRRHRGAHIQSSVPNDHAIKLHRRLPPGSRAALSMKELERSSFAERARTLTVVTLCGGHAAEDRPLPAGLVELDCASVREDT